MPVSAAAAQGSTSAGPVLAAAPRASYNRVVQDDKSAAHWTMGHPGTGNENDASGVAMQASFSGIQGEPHTTQE
jgi:hypothetical protein